jgi:hypothetical protein
LFGGALFAFMRETDPDVILVLEARGAKAARWEFAMVRMSVGALSVRHRNDEVWNVRELEHPYLRKNEEYTFFQKLPEPKTD